MSWETRARGGRYYTRFRRVNGRIVREYVGTGPLAEVVAERDRLEHERREDERATRRQVLNDLNAAEAPVAALHEQVDVLTRGAFLAAGFYRHHGEWRRRRA